MPHPALPLQVSFLPAGICRGDETVNDHALLCFGLNLGLFLVFASQGGGSILVLCVLSVASLLGWFSSLAAGSSDPVGCGHRASSLPGWAEASSAAGRGWQREAAKAVAKLGKALPCMLSPSRGVFYSKAETLDALPPAPGCREKARCPSESPGLGQTAPGSLKTGSLTAAGLQVLPKVMQKRPIGHVMGTVLMNVSDCTPAFFFPLFGSSGDCCSQRKRSLRCGWSTVHWLCCAGAQTWGGGGGGGVSAGFSHQRCANPENFLERGTI